MIEVVYEQQEEQAEVDKKLVAALDPGVNVLAAITSNKPGFGPRLVSGKPIKSVNQRYNQQRAEHQSRLAHEKRFTSRQLDQLTTKRNRRVDSYLHTASRRIIDLLVQEGIGVLVIGKIRFGSRKYPWGSALLNNLCKFLMPVSSGMTPLSGGRAEDPLAQPKQRAR